MVPRVAVAVLLTVSMAGCADVFPGNGGLQQVGPLDYIQDGTYTRWTVEVDTSAGESPAAATLNFAKARMEGLVKKPDGIHMVRNSQLPSQEVWTQAELVEAHEANQDLSTGDSTVVTHLMFVDGEFENRNVLGVTIGYDLIVIFSERIREGCSANAFCSNSQRAAEIVLAHEFGHAIGLVNRGVDMVTDHEDSAHPRHSDNDESIMWWEAENRNLFEFFGVFGSLPDDFDSDDRQDICAAGGKCSGGSTRDDPLIRLPPYQAL